jgi:hypothetical protein
VGFEAGDGCDARHRIAGCDVENGAEKYQAVAGYKARRDAQAERREGARMILAIVTIPAGTYEFLDLLMWGPVITIGLYIVASIAIYDAIAIPRHST